MSREPDMKESSKGDILSVRTLKTKNNNFHVLSGLIVRNELLIKTAIITVELKSWIFAPTTTEAQSKHCYYCTLPYFNTSLVPTRSDCFFLREILLRVRRGMSRPFVFWPRATSRVVHATVFPQEKAIRAPGDEAVLILCCKM